MEKLKGLIDFQTFPPILANIELCEKGFFKYMLTCLQQLPNIETYVYIQAVVVPFVGTPIQFR